MIRWVVLMLSAIVGITLLRGVIGLLGQTLRQVIDPPTPSPRNSPSPQAPTVEQVQCPTCGTWVAKNTAAAHKAAHQ
ncbi:MAG: hypothetical protein U0Q16_26945 [Bryobacteraceae bacterium]